MKPFLVAIWVACAASFFLPDTLAFAAFGRRLFVVLLGAHAIECLIFWKRISAAPGSLGHNLMQTLIYGILHLRTLPRAGETPTAS